MQAGEVFSARREAQMYLDSGRTSFVGRRNAAASKALHDAASFTRRQSDSASGEVKKALASSADELEHLATRVTKGTVKSAKSLDYAFARTQLAEAQYHYARAVAEWHATNTAAAGAEIVMVADHFERAAADASLPISDSVRNAVNNTRALGARLTQGASLVPAEVEWTMGAMKKEIGILTAKAAKLKGQ
jgi:hypothetical protein